ncbi:MAG: cell surface protein SprA [Porphyromonas sp.]|nr:cell surface protein SprA [Porphyromonas sp.]
MRLWRLAVVALLWLFFIEGWSAEAQSDSVAYLPKTGLYIVYHRDSLGTWRLREVLTPEQYYRARGERLLKEGMYRAGLPPAPQPLKMPPKLGLTANGYVTLNINQTTIEEDNPTLPVGLRKRSHILIDPEINVHLRAKYSERLQLDFTYDTQAAQAERRSRLRLRYSGEKYDLIQRLEAGNVRMESRNPLIDTGMDLFGIRSDLRLGAVTLQMVASRQYDEERKIVVQGGGQLRQTELKGSDYDFGQHFFLSEFFATLYNQSLSSLPVVQSDLYIERIEVWVTTARQFEAMGRAEPIVASTGASLSNTPPDDAQLASDGLSIAAAQRLPAASYTLQPQLGYISLHAPLAEGQLLAVAYTYRYRGERHTVGDLSGGEGIRRVALISDRNRTPQSPLWHLMMKNGYSLKGIGRDVTREGLRVSIVYKDYANGLERPIVDKGSHAGQSWMTLFGWDRADSSGRGGMPDGRFDFVEGVTYQRETGTLFLPFRRPFAEVPPEGYPSYNSLYTANQREAREEQDKDLFRIRAEAKGSTRRVVSLGHTVIEPGSIKVESGGRLLTEGVDYHVDLMSGTLTLHTESDERTEITIRERERVRRKEKSLFGAELNWSPLEELHIGGTIVSYQEESRRDKIRWGEEALRNNMWGLHADYRTESHRLKELFNQLTGLHLRDPFAIDLQASYAQLHSDYNMPAESRERIVIDDFETGNRFIDLTNPHGWQLGHLPSPELRSQMAWFTVDPLLVREGAKHQPQHLQQDKAQRDSPLVREVTVEEFYPKREQSPLQSLRVPTLNLSYYPEERGPYNPQPPSAASTMWGSMAQALAVNDLEQQKYSYIEVWLMDPFTLDPSAPEGLLMIDLGRVREKILPDDGPDDGLYFEGAEAKVETAWGKRAIVTPELYGFDTAGTVSMEQQDSGLDGLTSAEEGIHPAYAAFADTDDPARDDYRFFLGDAWDRQNASILERYKFINGMEGNSIDRVIQGVQSAYSHLPDTEDLDRDMVRQDDEGYFRYIIPITAEDMHSDMVVGEKRLSQNERWVKLRIPLKQPTERIGRQPSLQEAETVRLSLTGFDKETHLRLAQFRITSTAWSAFESSIEPTDRRTATLNVGRLSLEEDSDRQPTPYLSPPQVVREQAPSGWANYSEDEQSVTMEIEHLEPGQPTALYRDFSLDLRHYQRLELWSHLESEQMLASGAVELFIRLGQDFTENYYEYRMPLTPSIRKDYTSADEEEIRNALWLEENRLDIDLSGFTDLKTERDRSLHDTATPYIARDKGRHGASYLLKGHPTLGEVTSVMIGVRNKSDQTLSAEVWINELSTRGARATGGKASQVALRADLGELAWGRIEHQYRSAGFGGLTSDSRKMVLEETRNFALQSELQLGLLLPQAWQVRAPLRYSYHRRLSTPYFDPYDSDLRNKGRGGTASYRQIFELAELKRLPLGKKLKPWSIENLLLRYKVESNNGFSPEIEKQHYRRAESELSYNYNTSAQNYIRLNSLWNRLYRYQQFPSDRQSLSTLQSRWDWIRGLYIRQSIKGLTLSLQSTTQALVYEPFEAAHLQHQEAAFRWMTREILRDIAALGETQYYRGQAELTYRTPDFHTRLLKPLRLQTTWRSNYQWQLGAVNNGKRLGNRAENGGYFDLQLQYGLDQLHSRFNFHYRRTTGNSLPGLISGAGKLLGIGSLNGSMVPSLAFRLGLNDPQQTFDTAESEEWLIKEGGSIRPLTAFWRNEMDASLSLQPLQGLEIELIWQNNRQLHTTYTPYQQQPAQLQRGSLRYSTIVKPNKRPDRNNFIQQQTLLFISSKGLPDLLSTLPNWQINYNIVGWHEWLQKHFAEIKLTHSYRSYVELPTYYIENGQNDLQSITVSENLSPLIGLSVTSKIGISLEERYNRRKTQTLVNSSSRLLHQLDHELYSRLSYRTAFAPLFESRLRWLRAKSQSLLIQCHHTYTRTMMSQYFFNTETAGDNGLFTPLQGQKSHTLQLSAEYGLSDYISLRGFYERQQRLPLVSNYSFPYTRTNYGILLRLQFRP